MQSAKITLVTVLCQMGLPDEVSRLAAAVVPAQRRNVCSCHSRGSPAGAVAAGGRAVAVRAPAVVHVAAVAGRRARLLVLRQQRGEVELVALTRQWPAAQRGAMSD